MGIIFKTMACVGFDATQCDWTLEGTDDEYQFLYCCESGTTTAVTISMDADGFKTLFSDLEQMITTGYDLAKNMVLTDDMVWLSRAGLAAKCAVTSGFVNTWYLVAAAYGVAGFFGMDAIITQYADEYYGLLCACQIEVDGYALMFEQYGAFLMGAPTLYYTDSGCTTETTAVSTDCAWNGTTAPCYSMVEGGDAASEC